MKLCPTYLLFLASKTLLIEGAEGALSSWIAVFRGPQAPSSVWMAGKARGAAGWERRRRGRRARRARRSRRGRSPQEAGLLVFNPPLKLSTP